MQFLSATPVLASLDIERSVSFRESAFGFARVYCEQGVYGIVSRDAVQLHFRACSNPLIPQATSCRMRVDDIDALHERCAALGIVHPKAPLETKPWGQRGFAALDPDRNLLTFHALPAAQ
jgi:catechol 2,3-dioxygenase-like lactoylglutathione lyase family enzyme